MKNQVDRLGINSNLRRVAIWLLFPWGFLAFPACATTPKQVKEAREAVRESYELQKPIVVKTSEKDDRPEWTKVTVFEKDGSLHFTGGFLNGADYSLTVRCANAEALKAVIQSISQFVRAEFSQWVQGSNCGGEGVERHVEDGIATFSKNIHLQGTRQKEIYYEEVFSPTTLQTAYNVFVLLEMSKMDYMKNKADALNKVKEELSQAGETEAKKKAEKLLEDLKREVEGVKGV